MNWEAILALIREMRREQNLSQPDLAELAGVSRPTIARVERGNPIKPSSLQPLLDYLPLRMTIERIPK